MEGGGLKNGCVGLIGALIALILVVGGGFWFLGDQLKRQFTAPSPVTVAQASLEGLREQSRLSTFAARYVAVVTSTQSRLGLQAKKTLIMPGTVRYEVDLSKLQQRNLSWNGNKLTVTLPPIEVIGPEVDINNIREYGEGGILMSLTNVEEQLDEANRKAGQVELVRQAREETPMRLARDATRRAVERSFAMPLKAVGVDAQVEVLFPDETKGPDERWDVSRSVSDVLANRH
ncbi:DUF4230 domain-containing protein [Sphingomonas soli]|uniref:DUF4230 domain-containing protein n=1 Tax=Sphingomonas soli TaxID=266127 RepID=UPI00083102EE